LGAAPYNDKGEFGITSLFQLLEGGTLPCIDGWFVQQ